MIRMRTIFTIFFLVSFSNLLQAQDYYTEDFVYFDNIKSVKFHPVGQPTAYPIVKLGQNDRLLLSFDDLEAEDKRYSYRILHCDMEWNPSDLEEMEYLDGFNDEEIVDSYHSVQTKINYVHYKLALPNEYVNWTISGNYLLIIYDENEEAVITRRFLVVDPKVSVYAEFINPKKIGRLKTHQNLDITINHEDVYIRDPLNEVYVTVLQNFRWSDAITNRKAKNSIGYNLAFDPFEPFEFPALKEFRNFDIRSLAYTTRFVYSIRATTHKIEVLLEKDKKRTYTNFISDPDANGNFVLDNQDNPYGVAAAEYVNVGFTLESPIAFDKNDVYVVGGFSDWQLYDTNKMSYDAASGNYVADILLKQGYYDYYYALVNDDWEMNLETLEGNWYETDNTYYILVYLREFGSYYDKLVAMYSLR